jgi:putative ABC transport system permease protein
LYGLLLGLIIWALAILLLGDWSAVQFGLAIRLKALSMTEWGLLGGILVSGLIASCVPGWRAYRLSLVDGLSPRI